MPQGQTFPFQIEVAAQRWTGVKGCALITTRTGPCLVIACDPSQFASWQRRALAMGIPTVRHVPVVPIDHRHASKIDRRALVRQLGG